MLEGEYQFIKEAKQGNKEAFGQLYDHYLPKIYRFVYLKVTNQSEAEDLAHDVFLSAWQNMHRYNYQGLPFSSWLYQISKNAVIDFYRTSKKNIHIDAVSEDIFEVNERIPETLDIILITEKMKKIILKLKPDYQDVLIMRFVEDLSYEEIAAALDKSEGSIRLTQHRALKELKSFYDGTPTQEA
ncbi:MAG: RNA polymerase sigma factor [bacterium]|nr:RNA polymerase sigma factor [bacterium]